MNKKEWDEFDGNHVLGCIVIGSVGFFGLGLIFLSFLQAIGCACIGFVAGFIVSALTLDEARQQKRVQLAKKAKLEKEENEDVQSNNN